jgi:hypothetical protein
LWNSYIGRKSISWEKTLLPEFMTGDLLAIGSRSMAGWLTGFQIEKYHFGCKMHCQQQVTKDPDPNIGTLVIWGLR